MSSQGLNGYCDFLVSRAVQQTVITAPAIVVVEAKKGDLSLGLGQCAAEMVAAQQVQSAARASHCQQSMEPYRVEHYGSS